MLTDSVLYEGAGAFQTEVGLGEHLVHFYIGVVAEEVLVEEE